MQLLGFALNALVMVYLFLLHIVTTVIWPAESVQEQQPLNVLRAIQIIIYIKVLVAVLVPADITPTPQIGPAMVIISSITENLILQLIIIKKSLRYELCDL